MLRSQGLSRPAKARIAGALWLFIVMGVQGAGEFAVRSLGVLGDPGLGGARLLASETQFRAGTVAVLVAYGAYVVVTALLWDLLDEVGKLPAALAALFGIAGTAMGAAAVFTQLSPFLLIGADDSRSFSAEQIGALSGFLLNQSRSLGVMAWVMFGGQGITNGYLIARSTSIPRVLGIMLSIGAATYVVVPLVSVLWPASARMLFPIMAGAAFIGEGALSAWLIIRGLRSPTVEPRMAMN